MRVCSAHIGKYGIELQALAVLCIESEIALSLDYDSIINKFVEWKARKKIIAHE